MTAVEAPPAERPVVWKRIALLALFVGFGAFWVWALFFSSKEAINKIGDRAWAARAEQICAAANEAREALTDTTRIDRPTPELMAQRADVVDRATDLVEAMIDDVMAVAPTDPKGAAIVPDWAADYRTYIGDRREYAESIRSSGENLAFYETQVDGIPLSEKLETFAGDNEMPACAPPRDLSQ